MLSKFHGLIRALVATKKITIAAVHGLCLGGGAELAMVCDLVYTSERCRVGDFRNQAGLLSAGGVHGAGGAGRAEARGRDDSDRPFDEAGKRREFGLATRAVR